MSASGAKRLRSARRPDEPVRAKRPDRRAGASAARRPDRRQRREEAKPLTRMGLGFDLHPTADGRALVLGGVTVPASRGLGGHSDADVLTHAVCEALLGALALGDLGRLFPDTDERYRGVSSLVLLRGVMELVRTRGGRLVNVDATIICQAPRLAALLPDMATRLATTLEVETDRVSVKAKSPEHLGLLGREEGIAALAVVSVDVTPP